MNEVIILMMNRSYEHFKTQRKEMFLSSSSSYVIMNVMKLKEEDEKKFYNFFVVLHS